MANQWDKENPPNICFDCANAYADKCPYIRSRKARIIRKCVRFVPDPPRSTNKKEKIETIPYENLHDIAEKLNCSFDYLTHMTIAERITFARLRGYTMEIIPHGQYNKYRLIKNESPLKG